MLKKRLTREIASDLFWNEQILGFIIEVFKNLQKDPMGYLQKYRFMIGTSDSVLSSGYFSLLDINLSQLLFEFIHMFKDVQGTLESFYALEDHEKLRNVPNLPKHEKKAQFVLISLTRSSVYQKLKKQYYSEWKKQRIDLIHERYPERISQLDRKYHLQHKRRPRVKISQSIILCICFICLSALFVIKGIVNCQNFDPSFTHFIVATILFFTGIFFLTLIKTTNKPDKDKTNKKNRKKRK